MSAFTILATTNETTPQTFDLGERAEGLRFTTAHPGGCGVCSFTLPAEFGEQLSVPPYLGFNFRVDLLDGSEYFWSGRMGPPTLRYSPAGLSWQIEARGYGIALNDQFDQTRNVSGLQTSQIVLNAINNLGPGNWETSITATGVTLSSATAVTLTRLSAMGEIAWAMRFSDASETPQVFYVYPDPDGTVRFTFKPRESAESYTASLLDFETAEFGANEFGLANKITVQYNGGSSFAAVSDTTLQGIGPNGWNLVKEAIEVMPELTQSADALQAAEALLAAKKVLRLAPRGPMTVKTGALLLDSNGQEVKPWRIQAGRVMRLVDVSPSATADSSLAFQNSFQIAETDFQEDGQVLTLVPESFDVYIERSIAQVYSLLTGRHQL